MDILSARDILSAPTVFMRTFSLSFFPLLVTFLFPSYSSHISLPFQLNKFMRTFSLSFFPFLQRQHSSLNFVFFNFLNVVRIHFLAPDISHLNKIFKTIQKIGKLVAENFILRSRFAWRRSLDPDLDSHRRKMLDPDSHKRGWIQISDAG